VAYYISVFKIIVMNCLTDSLKLRATSLEDQTLEAMWVHYKSALNFAAREVL